MRVPSSGPLRPLPEEWSSIVMALHEGTPISLFLDIGQGAGLAGASGVRPFVPPLLAGGAARQDIGLDFDGTGYRFLEETWFLLAVLTLVVVAYALERVRASGGRRPGAETYDPTPAEPDPAGRPGGRNPIEAGLLLLALIFGAVLFAGSLDAGGETPWPGLIGGLACAALGYLAVAALFARARRRLEDATLLEVMADGVSLLVAILAIAAPPVGYAVLIAFVLLLVRAGSGEAKKYEGLRILR